MSDYEQDIERYCDVLRTEITRLQGALQTGDLQNLALTAEIERLRASDDDWASKFTVLLSDLEKSRWSYEQEIEILRNGLLTIAGARNKYVGDAGAFINSLQDTARHVLG